ncbi:hypothetical protein [Mediterranea massiliensis]|uniref:hypothetical protein n=1 Tax=Mediterranea massiliensis TaxID=1841865 RepID=UPI0025A3147A|nr:hypothetical protein [Mediterranea massiliensis]MDM8338404.1 hypothetical protein [Mediterranea massiliensis]
MRKIEKQSEPREWTAHRLTPGAKYEAKPELREALLKEQGYLCAYCMRRIPIRDTNSNETTRIDHILSRRNHPELQLNYSNMVVCCPGAITSDFHCDKQKGENDITFNLFEDHFFSYTFLFEQRRKAQIIGHRERPTDKRTTQSESRTPQKKQIGNISWCHSDDKQHGMDFLKHSSSD